MQNKTKRLTESAMLIAVAVVLELVSKMFIPGLPFGGQITLVSMLPVVLISYRHGMKWGFVASFTYALIEMAIGTKNVTAAFQPGYFGDGVMIANAFIMCFLDYIAAFTVLGLGGVFRDKIKNAGAALACGSLVALGGRYLCHIASGYILFSGWAEWFFCAAILAFGYATLLCWAGYGLEALRFLCRSRLAQILFFSAFGACILIGAVSAHERIWDVADFAIAAMTSMNLAVLWLMRREIRNESRRLL